MEGDWSPLFSRTMPIFVGGQISRPTERISSRALLLRDDAGAHEVVEPDLAVFDLVFEVDVGGAIAEYVGDLGQRQVVGGDQADRAALDQAAHDGFGADAAVVGIGAVQELVDQEQDGQRAGGQVDDLAQPRDLGVESRLAACSESLMRIDAPIASGDMRRRLARTGAPAWPARH